MEGQSSVSGLLLGWMGLGRRLVSMGLLQLLLLRGLRMSLISLRQRAEGVHLAKVEGVEGERVAGQERRKKRERGEGVSECGGKGAPKQPAFSLC